MRALFLFTGAKPNTDWLCGCLATDERGFVLTGDAIRADQLEDRLAAPLPLEASRPGIFCVGDARSGSTKRAATAIGEGSMAVRLVFERLNALNLRSRSFCPTRTRQPALRQGCRCAPPQPSRDPATRRPG